MDDNKIELPKNESLVKTPQCPLNYRILFPNTVTFDNLEHLVTKHHLQIFKTPLFGHLPQGDN